jgi:hypothetical protein
MFATVGIDQPIEKIMDDWDYLDEKIVKKFTTWQETGQNIIGIRRRTITLKEIVDPKKGTFNSVTMTPDGLLSKQHKALKIHITPGGVPHRVEHSLGFWHINDMDELYLPIPPRAGEEFGHFIVMMQKPTEKEGESFAQYCQQCLTIIYEHRFDHGKLGFAEFYRAERTSVLTYNGDPRLRLCPECGHQNPLAYSSNVVKDTPEQAEARRLW